MRFCACTHSIGTGVEVVVAAEVLADVEVRVLGVVVGVVVGAVVWQRYGLL